MSAKARLVQSPRCRDDDARDRCLGRFQSRRGVYTFGAVTAAYSPDPACPIPLCARFVAVCHPLRRNSKIKCSITACAAMIRHEPRSWVCSIVSLPLWRKSIVECQRKCFPKLHSDELYQCQLESCSCILLIARESWAVLTGLPGCASRSRVPETYFFANERFLKDTLATPRPRASEAKTGHWAALRGSGAQSSERSSLSSRPRPISTRLEN